VGKKGCGKALVPQSAPLISAPTLFLKKPVEKKEPHSGVLAVFLGTDAVNQVAKTSSI
jgi:hypothetical protein